MSTPNRTTERLKQKMVKVEAAEAFQRYRRHYASVVRGGVALFVTNKPNFMCTNGGVSL